IIFSGVVQDYAFFTTPSWGKIEAFPSGGNKGANDLCPVITAGFSIHSSTSTSIKVSSLPPISESKTQTKSLGSRNTAAFRLDSTVDKSEYISLPAGKSHLEVDMLMEKSQELKPGVDTYLVTVTITAQ
ncbi:hypothetical protein, partial [Nodularia sphaerocarpa]|uniref:hypothetical protein n=1 Tax=Nodularia sphaerocarpa TaxID=137816 RepID=UPI00232F30CD